MNHDRLKPAREPTFTPTELARVVGVLRAAENRLSRRKGDGKFAMICHAIDNYLTVADLTQDQLDAGVKLKALIKARLGSMATLRQWLVERGYPANSDEPAVYQRVQEARHQWVAALIKEMEHEQAGRRDDVRHAKRKTGAAHRSRTRSPGIFRDDLAGWWQAGPE